MRNTILIALVIAGCLLNSRCYQMPAAVNICSRSLENQHTKENDRTLEQIVFIKLNG